MKLTLEVLPEIAALLAIHEQAGQQPDNLCGPYWVSMLLQTYGGFPVSAVEVAKAASTILPSQGNSADWLPPGAASRMGEGYDTIPTVPNVDECGTSVDGLIQATKTLSQGRFCLVPLQSDHWESGLNALVRECHAHQDWGLVPLLNSHTSYFWGSRLTPSAVVQSLQTGKEPSTSPDWSVGHFALLAGHLQGQSHRLYAILDTYPQFGWNGLHLQPPEAIAQSLLRPQQSTQGGVLLFTKTEFQSPIQSWAQQHGFQIASWDNGSPFCPTGYNINPDLSPQ
ncbi:MAG: hypothetical protein AAF327_08285 [Cyanobacteria bacterium P01_A01_bin.37]